MKKPSISHARLLTALIPIAVVVIGLCTNLAPGTLSAFGIESIAAICPLGSLETMLASKTIIPLGVISLVCFIAICALFGKAFCGWICPASLWKRLRKPPKKATPRNMQVKPHSDGSSKPRLDSRFAVLAGALGSAAIFGFPVFCLICPIGLTFASIIALWRLFGFHEATIFVIAAPAIVILELVVFRKWCSKICPLGALISLASSLNRFWRPKVNESACLKCVEGDPSACGACESACEWDVDLRDADASEPLVECTKCGDCAASCPAKAISLKMLDRKS